MKCLSCESKPERKKTGAPAALVTAAKARMLAEVDFIKADLAYQVAYVQLMSLVGEP